MSEKEDAQLVREALDGDREAFEVLFLRYYTLVSCLALRWTRSLSDAEDITQDAFLPDRGEAAFQAYERLESLRQPEKFQAWLQAIVRNRCRRWSKRQSRLVYFDPFDESEGDQIPLLQQSRTPADEFEHNARYEAIIEAMRRLPEKFSIVLMLYYLEELSYQDIGRYLDVPTSTVKGRIHLGRQRLREEIEPIMQEMLFEIPEKVKVSGTVHFEGQPIEGATVYAYGAYRNEVRELQAETQTYKDGAFIFEALPNVNERLLIAAKPGFAFGWTFIKGIENTEDVAIELYEAETLCGTVLNTDEKPIQGAHAQAYNIGISGERLWMLQESKVARAVTDSKGYFCLSDIPKGAQLGIRITHPDYSKNQYIGLVAGEKMEVQASPSLLAKPSSFEDLTFELSKGGAIEGYLLYSTTGDPAAGIPLAAIRSPSPRGVTLAKTDENGYYRLENLTPGLHSVYLESKLDAWTMVAGKEIFVGEGETAKVPELKLIKGGWITGRLTDANTGEPFTDQWVVCQDSSRVTNVGSKTDENGVYRFRSAPGRTTILLKTPPGYDGPQQVFRPVEVAEGETVNADFSFHRKKTERFVIALITPDGKPVEGAKIYREINREENNYELLLSDDKGCFVLEWKGTHQEESLLFATWCTPSRKQSLFIIHPKLRLYGTAKVQHQTEGECQIQLSSYQTGEVKGRLVDENGVPVADAKISASTPVTPSIRNPWCLIDETMSDKEGSLRLSNLIVGRSHRLSISKKGYGNAGSSFVSTVETLTLPEIVLPTADQCIAGFITTPDGTPLPGVTVGVDVRLPGGQQGMVTGGKGRYRLTGLTKKRIRVKVGTEHSLVSREVIPGKDDVDFVIEKGDRFVSGKITDTSGNPISGAWLYVGEGETRYDTDSDRDGYYHLPYLVDETVELVVTYGKYGVSRVTETNRSDVDVVLTLV